MKWPREPRLLYEPIAYSLEEGGKRIRPVALLMACSAFRGGIDAAKPAAMAIEVFHNFTLLHDDIMDRSDMRRGKPAVHTRWNDNVAILSGDAMMIWAYRLLSQCDEAVLPQLLAVFTDVAVGVCEGQQYDMDFESRDDVTVEEYLRMIELKTAVLLAGALKIGALCGGAEPVQAELLYRFGIDLGMAFQLKTTCSTRMAIRRCSASPWEAILVGKKTYLLTTALKAADAPTRARLLALLHDAEMASGEKIAAVRAVYDSLAVRQTAERAVASYFDEARQVLRSLRLSEERLAPLRELSDMLLNRRK